MCLKGEDDNVLKVALESEKEMYLNKYDDMIITVVNKKIHLKDIKCWCTKKAEYEREKGENKDAESIK